MNKASLSKTIVWVELIADVLVAGVKIFPAFFTGSASMAAEGVHSVVDVGGGGLMLYGYQRSQRRPDRRHPLGDGRELWCFVVALLAEEQDGVEGANGVIATHLRLVLARTT
jgi:divalent metal cation (Fe/Co/Zn/Cd) transporter